MQPEPPDAAEEDRRWLLVALLFILVIAAIVYDSLRHPTRDDVITVTESGVTIEPADRSSS